jgi:PAS domain S-box-containing protein
VTIADIAANIGQGSGWLIISTAIAVAAAVCALMLLRDHLRIERHASGLERELERLQDRVFDLSDRAERHGALLEAHGDLITRHDREGRLTFVNDAYAQMLATVPEKLLGRMPPAPLRETSEPRLRDDGARMMDECLVTPSGERWIAWVETTLVPGRGQAEVLRVGRDITERVNSQIVLEEARRKAEAASSAKSRFLATVSHEVRTPLNGILGMAGLLSGTSLTPEQRSYVEAVEISGRTLLSLIDDILDFSKIEAGRLDIVSQPFDLHDLVERVVELLSPRAQDKGIEIAASVARGVPRRVVGDEDRLRQVLLNLAGNAVKFTQSGGVGLSVARGKAGEIVISVRDTGPGIAASQLGAIFEEFERADATLASRHEGVGLGLAISRRIVQRMQGTINVESTQGVGSCFRVNVPLPDADHQETEGASVPDLRRLRALIVSPSPFEAPFLATRLDEAGAQVERATGLKAARRMLDAHPHDVVLVDLALGEDTCRQVAQAAREAGVPRSLVLMSPFERRAFGPPEEAGFSGFLIKPVRSHSLFARVSGKPGAVTPHALPATAPAAVLPPHRVHVLVAEDNDINALLVRKILGKLGASVETVGNGRQAVERVGAMLDGTASFDLALLDIRMPDMGGLEAASAIRAAEARRGLQAHPPPRLKLIALTANAFPEDRAAALEAGFDGFMAKPVDPDMMTLLVRDARRAQGQDEDPDGEERPELGLSA